MSAVGDTTKKGGRGSEGREEEKLALNLIGGAQWCQLIEFIFLFSLLKVSFVGDGACLLSQPANSSSCSNASILGQAHSLSIPQSHFSILFTAITTRLCRIPKPAFSKRSINVPLSFLEADVRSLQSPAG